MAAKFDSLSSKKLSFNRVVQPWPFPTMWLAGFLLTLPGSIRKKERDLIVDGCMAQRKEWENAV